MVEKYDSTEREAERPKFLLEEKETYVPDFARDDEAGGASNESKELKNCSRCESGSAARNCSAPCHGVSGFQEPV